VEPGASARAEFSWGHGWVSVAGSWERSSLMDGCSTGLPDPEHQFGSRPPSSLGQQGLLELNLLMIISQKKLLMIN
jgi:hypothetical protein